MKSRIVSRKQIINLDFVVLCACGRPTCGLRLLSSVKNQVLLKENTWDEVVLFLGHYYQNWKMVSRQLLLLEISY